MSEKEEELIENVTYTNVKICNRFHTPTRRFTTWFNTISLSTGEFFENP